ncbi:unnamed protein product [Paramecium sonneborni]|uniref:Uncharacterized protein n=1 Tax=Paramecium sonneborni TaxID=65129 RepID=A0A8S1N3Y2_9CILI|nr:unnamed protein product [Paramecium sonneborni]
MFSEQFKPLIHIYQTKKLITQIALGYSKTHRLIYLYNLIFQQQTFEYFKQNECKIFKNKIIQTEFAKIEQINQFQVWKLRHNIKHICTSIDQI